MPLYKPDELLMAWDLNYSMQLLSPLSKYSILMSNSQSHTSSSNMESVTCLICFVTCY